MKSVLKRVFGEISPVVADFGTERLTFGKQPTSVEDVIECYPSGGPSIQTLCFTSYDCLKAPLFNDQVQVPESLCCCWLCYCPCWLWWW